MVLVKQYMENSWYRGGSQDRQTGYGSQYQFGYGVNTRDMKNGVCLAGGVKSTRTYDGKATYFVYNGKLYALTSSGKVIDTSDGTTKISGLTGGGLLKNQYAYQFGNGVFCALGNKIRVVIGSGGTRTKVDVTPTGFNNITCMLNYANTFMLFGDGNKLWRFDYSMGSYVAEMFKQIRKFDSGYIIYGLSLEGNYLKIYTSDGKNTKIHYAKGTFDVEESGLVQTISFKGMGLMENRVASDQGRDYALFDVGNDLKLSKISGYNKTDIKWTQRFGSASDVGNFFSVNYPYVHASDGVLFVGTDEGIWTFTEYNGWLWGGCLEFPSSNWEQISCIFRFNEELYVCYVGTNSYTEKVFDLSFQPTVYQSTGYIIGRVFDGGCGSLFKKNIQTTITYKMPTNTSMELSYRYDRKTYGYDKSNFKSVKIMSDTTTCYDIIVPTTDNDFNMPRNYIEYRIDLNTSSTSKSPILFEHNLLYNDSMRKYR